MAVSPDGAWLAVPCLDVNRILVYAATPPHALLRTIGSCGAGEGQLNGPCRMCFTPAGNLLVCDYYNNRVQELTLDGEHVRSFVVQNPYSLALCDDVLAVGTYSSPHIRLLSYPSGAALREFGPQGAGDGQIGSLATGMRFTRDGRFLVVAECRNQRASRHQGRKPVATWRPRRLGPAAAPPKDQYFALRSLLWTR